MRNVFNGPCLFKTVSREVQTSLNLDEHNEMKEMAKVKQK